MSLAIPYLPKLVRHVTLAPLLTECKPLAAGDAAFGVEVW